MKCHGSDVSDSKEGKKGDQQADGLRKVMLLGNPNVGKSVIFGLLTGKYATVSNYPGTTVEISQGNIEIEGKKFLLMDTPGVNSLVPMSEDERVTRDILLAERPSVVLQVGDAKNLKRTLALSVQMAEMGLPMILDLNMQDEAMDRGITLDMKAIRDSLGIEVVGTVAPERKGLKALRAALIKEPAVPDVQVTYDPIIEDYVRTVSGLLPEANISARSLALMVLAGDESLGSWLHVNMQEAGVEELERLRDECAQKLGRPVSSIIGETRLALATELTEGFMQKSEETTGSFAEKLGRACMHPLWGMLILLAVLFGLYEFVGVLGADILVGFVEETFFGKYLNPFFIRLVEDVVPTKFLQEMLVGEYGTITMALTYAIGLILPITTTFFIAFSLLEDSGYLPRLAIMSNRFFNMMGLNGKAVLPMVLGLGCGTMAVMTTRILESKRDRLIATFLLALAVPCAAQLGVIMGMLGAQSIKILGIWMLTILGVLLFTGYLANKIVPGKQSDFFLEIPPLRVPSIRNILLKTWGRVFWYLREALPLFVLGTFVLFALDKLLLLGVIEDLASPLIVNVLGLPKEATAAFLIGFLRRDYGAAGLFAMAEQGLLDPVQSVVSLVTMTLFVPCLAHYMMMIKERGIKLSLIIAIIILPMALAVGGTLNWALRLFDIPL